MDPQAPQPTDGERRRVAVVVSRCPQVGPACAAELADPATPGEPRPDVVVLVGVGDAPDGVQVAASVDEALDAHGPAAILVTVPGAGFARSVARAGDDGSFDRHLAEELSSVHQAIRAVVPEMVAARDGRIVVVSAATALFGASWETAHGAAMAGLVGLVRSAARELASSGITVNAVLQGAIETDHLAEVRDRDRRGADAVAAAVAATPVRRLGTPQDVAAAVGYLASRGASYTTGVVLPVDGGLAMGIG